MCRLPMRACTALRAGGSSRGPRPYFWIQSPRHVAMHSAAQGTCRWRSLVEVRLGHWRAWPGAPRSTRRSSCACRAGSTAPCSLSCRCRAAWQATGWAPPAAGRAKAGWPGCPSSRGTACRSCMPRRPPARQRDAFSAVCMPQVLRSPSRAACSGTLAMAHYNADRIMQPYCAARLCNGHAHAPPGCTGGPVGSCGCSSCSPRSPCALIVQALVLGSAAWRRE